MNKRPFIIGGIVLLIAAISVAVLLILNPSSPANPTPSTGPSGGTITLPDGAVVPADPNEAVNKPEPSGSRNPDGSLEVADPHFGDGNVHQDEVVQCGTGPYTVACGDEESYTMPAADAIDKASAAAKRFAEEWLTIDPKETAESRASRLTAVGGIGTVPSQISALTRPNTALSGLTTASVPYGQMYSAFTRVADGKIVLVISAAASVTYNLNDSQTQTWSMPGTILISVDPNTDQITGVIENFPNLEGLV